MQQDTGEKQEARGRTLKHCAAVELAHLIISGVVNKSRHLFQSPCHGL